MLLKDLMLTDEETQEICVKCADQPALIKCPREIAAIIKAIKEIRDAMLRPNFQGEWDALLKEVEG